MRLISFLVACILCTPAVSHEFWIEPSAYQVRPGSELKADFKNGEGFKGPSHGFFDRRSQRLEMRTQGNVFPLLPRNGDVPAISLNTPEAPGLLVLVHETTPSRITYKTWEKFAKFATHKDFKGVEARHRERNLPREGFSESYSRFVKALVANGSGDGADAVTGLETEFVALTNPYDADFDGTFRVRVLYQGQPRSDAQVEVFARAPDGSVAVTLHRTDTDGIAGIPVAPAHSYLLDAVVLRALEDDEASVWETLWASMTFAVPG